jgi:membrane protease YdiL (CAAX protease family)
VLTFVAAVFLFGVLLSPVVFWSVQTAARSFPLLRSLADNPFPRFVSRTLMMLAISGLWPLHRVLAGPSPGALGLKVERNWRATVSLAFAVGFLTLGLLVMGGWLAGQREWRTTISGARFARTILLSTLGAAVVATLEEIVFRGVLFGCLRSRQRWIGALMLSSVVFAAAHFLQMPKDPVAVTWWSGFEVLGAMFTGGAVEHRLPQFINLALCGGLLAWAYQRTGSLLFSIGLHGGWIVWLKLANAVTIVTAANAFWGTRKVIDGWAATGCLILLAVVLPRLTRKPIPQTNHVPTVSSEAPAVG